MLNLLRPQASAFSYNNVLVIVESSIDIASFLLVLGTRLVK